jgi:hypothetical protein
MFALIFSILWTGSLRVEEDRDSTWYVWVDFDGSTRRSTRDPREDWDSDSMAMAETAGVIEAGAGRKRSPCHRPELAQAAKQGRGASGERT